MDDAVPEIRVGDDERRAVDTRLQQAHADGRITLTEYDERSRLCWEARTRGDLARLTRDLPASPAPEGAAGPAVPPPAPARSGGHRIGRTLGGLAVVAVVGFAGFQVLGASDGRAVLGDTTVRPAPGQTHMEVGMLFGHVTVVVPDDVHVTTTGTVIAGSRVCEQACTPAPPGARTLVVDASGALGDVRVLTETEAATLPQGRERDDRH